MSSSEQADELLLASKGSIPEHVVFRALPRRRSSSIFSPANTTVSTRSGVDLIELLPRAATLRAAALQIAEEYDRPVEEVEADVVEFCRDLQERGLVDFSANGHH